MITLLLVEDDIQVRQGLRTWLERAADITVVGETGNGVEACALAQALQPTVILLDLPSSAHHGITMTAALHALVPQSRIVLLSLHEGAVLRAQARAAGAVMVVGKQGGGQALLEAIRQVGGPEEVCLPVTSQEVEP
ncbi:MAG: response regulator transcription factor [Ktedonobacteraceae bacterium]|nr:response regulator transcription factor [Ktedonobacteraceae bacterium]